MKSSQNYLEEVRIHNTETANQSILKLAIDEMKQIVENYIVAQEKKLEEELVVELPLEKPIPRLQTSQGQEFISNLEHLCSAFRLSTFEYYCLLLAAAREIDSSWGELCARAHGNDDCNYPSIYMAHKVFACEDWSIYSSDSTLRYWELIKINENQPQTFQPLEIDRHIMSYLLGLPYIDSRLSQYVSPVRLGDRQGVLPSHLELAKKIRNTCMASSRGLPFIQLVGSHLSIKRDIAALVCHFLQLQLYRMPVSVLDDDDMDVHRFLLRWQRESLLQGYCLMLECDELNPNSPKQMQRLSKLLRQIGTAVIISSRDRISPERPTINYDIPPLTVSEQREMWNYHLGEAASHLNGYLDALVYNFQLSPQDIQIAAAKAGSESAEPTGFAPALWKTCREQSRPRLDELAQRIEPKATWSDLILPENRKQTLQDMISMVRQRSTVYEHWGFGSKSGRGFGITAVFAGTSGTGKTMAAEVIAKELELDLYQVDLSSITSKYVGETEKNLARLFDAADTGGVILLFDEGEALFGKRTEVKDSKDRYANLEVNYLLQRLEAYRGLAIITTNIVDSLDSAFIRRLRFIIDFPFPAEQERAQIWHRTFPNGVLDIQPGDFNKLARLNVAGGIIRSIALRSAFLAAEEGSKVQMRHILQATKNEYEKMGRLLSPAEVHGWVCKN